MGSTHDFNCEEIFLFNAFLSSRKGRNWDDLDNDIYFVIDFEGDELVFVFPFLETNDRFCFFLPLVTRILGSRSVI